MNDQNIYEKEFISNDSIKSYEQIENIINYNEVDCRILYEILTYLRNNHTEFDNDEFEIINSEEINGPKIIDMDPGINEQEIIEINSEINDQEIDEEIYQEDDQEKINKKETTILGTVYDIIDSNFIIKAPFKYIYNGIKSMF